MAKLLPSRLNLHPMVKDFFCASREVHLVLAISNFSVSVIVFLFVLVRSDSCLSTYYPSYWIRDRTSGRFGTSGFLDHKLPPCNDSLVDYIELCIPQHRNHMNHVCDRDTRP